MAFVLDHRETLEPRERAGLRLVFGAGGALARGSRPLLSPVGSALAPAVLFAEATMTTRDATAMLLAALGVLVLGLLARHCPESLRLAVALLGWTVGGVLAYGLVAHSIS